MDATLIAPISSDDERAIRAVVAEAQARQNDVDGLMQLHTPDAVIVNLAGRRVLGRAAFAEAMAGALASPLADVRTTVEVVDVRGAAPDVAVVSCVKTVHDERRDAAAALPAVGAMTYVMSKAGDGWRIALAQTTPVL